MLLRESIKSIGVITDNDHRILENLVSYGEDMSGSKYNPGSILKCVSNGFDKKELKGNKSHWMMLLSIAAFNCNR